MHLNANCLSTGWLNILGNLNNCNWGRTNSVAIGYQLTQRDSYLSVSRQIKEE